MNHNYKVGDIFEYPVPGIVLGKCEDNIVPTQAKILKIYDDISKDGIIVDMKLIDSKIKISGKL